MEDEKLIALLDRKFAESEERMTARLDVKSDDMRIEVGARLDGMHSDIKKIAEGVDNVGERLDRFRLETNETLVDIRSDLRVSFSMLGKRITDLENAH